MNIAIIGGGSIGLLMSTYLSEHHEVTLYVRRIRQKNQINLQQINRLHDGEHMRTSNVSAKVLEESMEDIDICIVCVKQTQLKDVLVKCTDLADDIPLLFLQNGMGHVEALQSIPNPVYLGVVNHGSHRTSDNYVHHLGNGSIDIASLSGSEQELQMLIDVLHETKFPLLFNSDWTLLLKEKLIVNAVINPLTALFDVPNGNIITNNSLKKLAKNICEEVADVLDLPIEESWEKVTRIAEQTKENVSSMRADILENRETEVEAIIGYIVKKSKTPIPNTMFVYHAILALQQERTL